MVRARQKDAWAHTSNILAMLANTAISRPSGKSYAAYDFSPFPEEHRSKNDIILKGYTFKRLKEIIKKGGSVGF